MRRRYYSATKQEVEIDECPACGGIWLDSGELEAIRAQYPPGVDRDRAEQEYWQEKVGRRFDSLAGTYRNMADAMRRARERRRRNMHWSHY
jgi:Zn-finger nucleic acid-binding protein